MPPPPELCAAGARPRRSVSRPSHSPGLPIDSLNCAMVLGPPIGRALHRTHNWETCSVRRTSDGAQMALDVVERLAVRPPPNDVAWMDEVLLGWSRLPAGRSAIARALSEVWHSQMPNQI